MPCLDWNVNKSRHILEENWQLEEYCEDQSQNLSEPVHIKLDFSAKRKMAAEGFLGSLQKDLFH